MNLRKAGRPPNQISEEIEEKIIRCKSDFDFGMTKTYSKLLYETKDDEVAPTYHTVRKVFEKHDLFAPRKNQKKVGNTRYEAIYSNLIWHVDIHFLNGSQDQPFYAIIDDYSRFIVGYKRLRNKKAKSCAKILENSINEFGKPFCIWSDNGSETKGDFEEFLTENEIQHVRTQAYCPQQNGKIERFWRIFEKLLKKYNIDQAIDVYNNTPHLSLPIINKQVNGKSVKINLTPSQAFNDLEKRWEPGKEPRWKIDGNEKAFNPNSLNEDSTDSESDSSD